MDFIEKVFAGLPPRSVERIRGLAERREYGPRQTVVREGEPDRRFWFVERGSVRTFVMREERCVILHFAFEGEAAAPGFGPRTTAPCTIETLERATLVGFPREQTEALFARDAALADWARRLTERTLEKHLEYFADWCWMDKGRQYERLLAEYPQLLQRVALKDLAAWLLITPQTLSRIRAGIK